MTAVSYAVRNSATMLRRHFRHTLRYPGMTLWTVLFPIVFLLLFVYVFGGTLSAGFGGSKSDYVNFIVPGVVVLAVCSGAGSTAVAVNVDVTGGIVDRFRTMAIARTSVLTGHVVGSTIQTTICALLVFLVGLLMGFRPNAGLLDWLAVVGILALTAFAITWLSVALGLHARNPEAASNLVLPIQILPILGAAFVRPDSMPFGIRWLADYQPFTPIMGTLRELLSGAPLDAQPLASVVWCAGIALLGYLWARARYRRGRAG
jgi:ABC-2 type transport system permease protein